MRKESYLTKEEMKIKTKWMKIWYHLIVYNDMTAFKSFRFFFLILKRQKMKKNCRKTNE